VRTCPAAANLPSLRNPGPVQVGFIGRGKFCLLFNAPLPTGGPPHEFGVPKYCLWLRRLPEVSFQYKGAAVLSLPATARREDTLAPDDFRRWIGRHISTAGLILSKGLGVELMEEIILVTGCDRTRPWINVAFLRNQVDVGASIGVKVKGPDTSINFRFSPENALGAVLCHGPQGKVRLFIV
jgi:hypothetical protein